MTIFGKFSANILAHADTNLKIAMVVLFLFA